MADGRLFTDYRSRCDLNGVAGVQAPSDTHGARQFLVNNAAAIMSKDRATAYGRGSCAPCVTPYDSGTMLPEQDVYSCTAQTCKVERRPGGGLGVGRSYATNAQEASHIASERAEFVRAKEAEQAAACKMCSNGK